MKYYSPERAYLGMRGMKAASFGGTGGVRAAHENVCNTCRDTFFFNMLLRGGKPAFRVVKSEN